MKQPKKKQVLPSRRQLNNYLKQRTLPIIQVKLDKGKELADRFQLHRWDYIVAGDGSATGLETPAGFGTVLYSRIDGSRKRFFGGLSHATSNMAELMAVFSPLLYLDRKIKSKEEKPIVYIFSDSSYVVNIGNNEATPKNNFALWAGINNLRDKLNLIFIHVNRMLLPANVFGDKAGKLIRTSFETFNTLLHKDDNNKNNSNNDCR